MKEWRTRDWAAVVSAAIVLLAIGRALATEGVEAIKGPKSDPKLPTLFLIGDSTVKNGTKGQMGWGEVIGTFFDLSRINVENHALGGTSSRSYSRLGRWEKVLAAMKPGDYLLMQFGHNDGGSINEPTRFRASLKGNGDETQPATNPTTGEKETVHSYGWYLRRYIAAAKARGVTVIVLSPVPRNNWSDDGKTVLRASKDYGKWAMEAAKQEGVAFVNLNDIVARRYEAEGKAKVDAVYFHLPDMRTHTTPAGARVNAACVVEGLRALAVCDLKNYLKPEAASSTQPTP